MNHTENAIAVIKGKFDKREYVSLLIKLDNVNLM